MSLFPRRRFVPVLCLLALLSVGAAALSRPAEAPAGPAKLAVLVVFDQMRGDYPTRWESLFDGGFRRILHDGASYRNCNYPYAFTVTGAGHASLATGTSPRTHGIVGNDWYDRAAGEEVNCVATSRYQPIPPEQPSAGGGAARSTGAWPGRLMAPTLSDAIKKATDNKARVVSLSFKDRGAVLPGGQHPDACYWFDTGTGRFVTSTYYRDRVHPWVEAFNARKPADYWFDRPWLRLRPELDYAKYSGPDDAPGEASGYGQGVTFPHPMTGGLKQPGRRYYDSLFTSPFGNDLLLDLALTAVDEEKLGRHEAPDLLCLSFSCNDYVGHSWGPDSQEVLDVTLRSDVIVQKLLDRLDRDVGKGRYVVAISADHGVCPLPEVSRLHGLDARRVSPAELTTPAEKYLRERYHTATDTFCFQRFKSGVAINDSISLNRIWLRDASLDAATVETALADFLRKQPAVASAWTATQLSAPTPPADELAKREWNSFYAGRSGDVHVELKPYYLFSLGINSGTTHGTPYPYDTHVPLLVYGPGVRPGARTEAVTPQAAVAILAHGLGIAPPAKCDAAVPEGLFER
jgi:hypothetical protein